MKNNFRNSFTLVAVILVISFLSSQTLQVQAYTTCGGIERNDVVLVDYVGTIQEDGSQFDEGTGVQFTVTTGTGGVILGFYEGLLGMKKDQRKTIVVPPAKGYTDPNAPLYGKTLIFNTFISAIVSDIEDCNENSGRSTTETILRVFGWLLGLGVVGFVGISMYLQFQKTTTGVCIHCKENGRSRLSEGKCSKCGNAYCRASFSRGCPNCGSNSFLPNS